ncbi:hypothetical protein CNMCM8686_002957 [Aspergillus fumigatus]|nr:hypothetical protein CNMCM8686_002957 [Aspergillus fumigatus]
MGAQPAGGHSAGRGPHRRRYTIGERPSAPARRTGVDAEAAFAPRGDLDSGQRPVPPARGPGQSVPGRDR